METKSFERRSIEYHDALPGLVRATLVGHGISNDVINRRRLGWDRRYGTIPVRSLRGSISFFERWDAAVVGTPIQHVSAVELFGWDILEPAPEQVLIAEGIHEALVLESQGFPSIAASGAGRFFKRREWAPALRQIPRVVLAYRLGEKRERRRFLHSRLELIDKVRRAVARAVLLKWPEEVGEHGGAYEFFVTLRKTPEDFRSLLAETS